MTMSKLRLLLMNPSLQQYADFGISVTAHLVLTLLLLA